MPASRNPSYVTYHAIRRYAERALGRHESLDSTTDRAAVILLRRVGVNVDWIRKRLFQIATIAARYGAPTVIADGIKAVIKRGRVVTVLERRWIPA